MIGRFADYLIPVIIGAVIGVLVTACVLRGPAVAATMPPEADIRAVATFPTPSVPLTAYTTAPIGGGGAFRAGLADSVPLARPLSP